MEVSLVVLLLIRSTYEAKLVKKTGSTLGNELEWLGEQVQEINSKKINFSPIIGEVRRIISFYLVITSLGLLGLFFSQFFSVPYNYLFITPSFFNSESLNWTMGVWGTVLSLHGTIAALSITFMGVFVSQVSEYSEHGFESVCRVLLLRENKFLNFSIESISGLIYGIVLLAFGTGLIAYLTSMLISLYFITSYGVMYYRLYNLTERPEFITELLFMDLKRTGLEYDSILLKKVSVNDDFHKLIASKINLAESENAYSYRSIPLNIFSELDGELLSGFSPEQFQKIDDEVGRLRETLDLHLVFRLNFYSPLTSSSIEIRLPEEQCVDDAIIYKLEGVVKDALFFENTTDIFQRFEQLEKSLIQNIKNALLSGNEWGLDFGVNAFGDLSSGVSFVHTLQKLDLSISSSSKKNCVDYNILVKFLDKLLLKSYEQKKTDNALNALRGIIDFARYIYTHEYFYEFYKGISPHLENSARYKSPEGDEGFLDFYISTTTQNLVAKNYRAFDLNTKFITERMQYLNNNEREHLSSMQRKLLMCVKEILTLLIIRMEHVRKNQSDNLDEISTLQGFIKSWVNASFLVEVYYKSETYDILFKIPDDFSMFNAERSMRDVSDGEAAWVSIRNDTYKTLAIILSASDFNRNRLNLIFLRDTDEFLSKTKINTHDIKSIVDFLRGDDYKELMSKISANALTNSNYKNLTAKLEELVSNINKIIIKGISQEDLKPDLVEKYKTEFNLSFERFIGKIIKLNDVSFGEFDNEKIYSSLIDKREVLNSVDGVHYSMNAGHHGQSAVYSWVRKLLGSLSVKENNIVNLYNISELQGKELVTVEYKISDGVDVYHYSKGLRMTDKDGVLSFPLPGLYYVDLTECYSFWRKKEIVDVYITKINNENSESFQDRFNLTGVNPLLYASIDAFININAELRESFNIYYLSESKCKTLNEENTVEMQQLTDMRNLPTEGDEIS